MKFSRLTWFVFCAWIQVVSFCCKAQVREPIRKILIIDRLIGDANAFWGNVDDRDTGLGRSGVVAILPFPRIVSQNGRPALQIMVSAFNPDAVVRLKLDDSDGFAILHGLFRMKAEEIRITSWRVFPNRFRDTIFKRLIEYHVVPADTPHSYHSVTDVVSVERVLRARRFRYPSVMSVTVNDRSYDQSLQRVRQKKQLLSWHGHPAMSDDAWLELKSSGNPYDIYTGSLFQFRPRLSAIINLAD